MIVAATPAQVAPCPATSEARRLPVRGRVLSIDLDGDGRRDRAAIHVALRSRARCAFFLVYDLKGGAVAARIPITDEQYGFWPAAYELRTLHEPSIVYGVDLHRGPRDVLVRVADGASYSHNLLFGVARRELHLLLDFEVGGFVNGGTTSVGCGTRRAIVKRWSGPTRWDGERYRARGFVETTYRLRGTRYAKVSTRQNLDLSLRRSARFESGWLFAGSDGLANCAVT